jgi:hypothetical protein
MFPELLEEPDAYKFSQYRDIWLQMIPYELYDDKNNMYYGYNLTLDLPNGDWKTTYFFKPKTAADTAEKIEIPHQELDTLKIKLEPEPISQES